MSYPSSLHHRLYHYSMLVYIAMGFQNADLRSFPNSLSGAYLLIESRKL